MVAPNTGDGSWDYGSLLDRSPTLTLSNTVIALDTARPAWATVSGHKTLGGSMELATTINYGATEFYAPENPNWIFHPIIPRGRSIDRRSIQTPVYWLSTIIKMFEHGRIDLLKMNVEGAEYEVIEVGVTQLSMIWHSKRPVAAKTEHAIMATA
jgi:hypothetical protein